MICKNCGFSFPDTEKYCPACGRPVDNIQTNQQKNMPLQNTPSEIIPPKNTVYNSNMAQSHPPLQQNKIYQDITQNIPHEHNSSGQENIPKQQISPQNQYNYTQQNAQDPLPNSSMDSGYVDHQNSTKKKPQKWIKTASVFLLGLVVGIGLNSISSSGKEDAISTSTLAAETPINSSSTQSTAQSSTPHASIRSSFKDNTLITKDAVIQYTGSEQGSDYNGDPVLYTFFTVTNNSDESQHVQFFLRNYVNFTQNLGSTTKDLSYAILSDSPYQAKLDLLQQDINPGSTVEMVYAFNIEDETKLININFKENMFAGKIIGTIEVAP